MGRVFGPVLRMLPDYRYSKLRFLRAENVSRPTVAATYMMSMTLYDVLVCITSVYPKTAAQPRFDRGFLHPIFLYIRVFVSTVYDFRRDEILDRNRG